MPSRSSAAAYQPLRWGILGTGRIARIFAGDLRRLGDHVVAAVGSRDQRTAEAFGREMGIPRCHGSYEDLVADPGIDAVYVATPHPQHCPNALLALEAGRHVLVEKPFAMDAAEAARMISCARRSGLFLLEGMWPRFLPHVAEIRKVLADGVLGEVTTLIADHGWWFPRDPSSRLFAPELGGGALLDLGVYLVSLASMVLGTPRRVVAIGDRAFTGVDAQTSILLQYPSGAHAVLTTTLRATTTNRAEIIGTEARLEIDSIFYTPTSFTVIHRDGRVLRRFENTYQGHGVREDAVEVARCLRGGVPESPLLPLDETLSVMKVLDAVRAQKTAGLETPHA